MVVSMHSHAGAWERDKNGLKVYAYVIGGLYNRVVSMRSHAGARERDVPHTRKESYV